MKFFVYPYVVYTQYQRFKGLIASFNLETFDEFWNCSEVLELAQVYSLTKVSAWQIWKDLSRWTPNYVMIHVTCPSPNSLPFCTWKDLSAALFQVESTIELRFSKMSRVSGSSSPCINWCIEFSKKNFDSFYKKYPFLVEKANALFFQPV